MTLDEDLTRESETWKPDPGQTLVGRITDLGTNETKFGEYPVVTVVTDDDRELVWHACHTVGKNELAKRQPKVGDQLGVKYEGKPAGKPYEMYRVRVKHVAPQPATEPDWSAMAAESAEELELEDRTAQTGSAPEWEHEAFLRDDDEPEDETY